MSHPPRLRIFTLGGTIAMARPAAAGADGGGVSPSLGGQALIDAVPGLSDLAAITVEPVAELGSGNLGFATAVDLARRIRSSQADGHVVVTGTDTLEELAFALDLMLGAQARTVVTGAMRAADAPGADGPANLLAAVRVAGCAGLRGRGVVVVMNDTIHAARMVTKGHSQRLDAFVSPDVGPAGFVAEGHVVFNGLIRRPPALEGVERDDLACPAVALWEAAFDDDGRLLDQIAPAGYRAAVLAGFGGGHLSEAQADRAADLAKLMPVVLAGRAGTGRVLTETYGYVGAERDLIARGLIPAGCYTPRKARVLTAVALAADYSRDGLTHLLAA
ncbi:hypothetical protein CCR85_04530 [Rhodothalassium salexigens]|uniref:asparaginase n=1 Tax=Rhodothalassium salexigens TaxID=1086 RepID=UPI0019145C95|nr:asparaginase [Rhodothalassium salexigens]MBK5910758.1 hypothetical protein [Rhodothalassium salexigens]MBK5919792.1 hypothetical protein [Rhodothalassium salexigens]